MNDSVVSESLAGEPVAAFSPYSGTIRTKFAAAAVAGRPLTIEFVGASDDTIAEAVRRALACAFESLRTLDGAGVRVMPEVYREGPTPRYRVTLQVTAANRSPDSDLTLSRLLPPPPR
jgi:flavin-binding protein dodecin